jgi:predicted dehydrogenase
MLKRGTDAPVAIACPKNDPLVEQLEEFAAAVRGDGKPEMGGDDSTTSLAVIRAGILAARDGRRVEIAEVLSND